MELEANWDRLHKSTWMIKVGGPLLVKSYQRFFPSWYITP